MAYEVGPFDQTHLLIQWGGLLSTSGERWSCQLRLRPVAGGSANPVADCVSLRAAVVTAVQAFHTRATTQIHADALLTFVKLNAIGLDGKYMNPITSQTTLASIPGGSSVVRHPNQVALVVSVTTSVQHGPAHWGRFFLPLPSMVVAATGLIGLTDRGNVVASATTLLTDLNAVSANYKVANFSRKKGAPASIPATFFKVGKALDTQRRRRRTLVEGA